MIDKITLIVFRSIITFLVKKGVYVGYDHIEINNHRYFIDHDDDMQELCKMWHEEED